MLLILRDEHKEHLEFLNSVSVDVVREFSRISVEFLKKGTNPKVYQSAAQKLGVDAKTVKSAVEGLMFLHLECSKLMLNEIDFQDSIKTLGYSDELVQEILAQYLEHRAEIRRIQSEMSMDLPHYRNLEWRLDVQVASRSLRQQVEPHVTLKLHTTDGQSDAVTVLQVDATNLLHLTRSLEGALHEVGSSHSRRIARNF